ncbi:MAG: hypothetical protein WBM38_00895 [Arenicellales bacterium]|jgi:hypothetical protein
MEEQKSSDFMVDIVNSEAGMGASEILIVVLIAAAVAIGITWWLKRK